MELEIDGFEWDKGNSEKNFLKHGVTIQEAEEVFLNQPLMMFPDPKHSKVEERRVAFGRTFGGRLLTIAFTLRMKGEQTFIRPISARPVHRKEKQIYEEATTEI